MTSEVEAARARIVASALTWVGTPFHDNAEVKGRNGGVDCARFIKCVMVEAGVVDDFHVPVYSPQHYMNHAEQKFLNVVMQFASETDQPNPGDVALYWIGKAFAHGAIVIDPGWPRIVHAHAAVGRVITGSGLAVHLGPAIKQIKFFSLW